MLVAADIVETSAGSDCAGFKGWDCIRHHMNSDRHNTTMSRRQTNNVSRLTGVVCVSRTFE